MNLLSVEKLFYVGATGQPALENISLTVGKDEIVFIAGKSGEGKTALLGIIYGINRFSTGRILLSGIEINYNSVKQIRELRKQVGFFSAEDLLLNDRSVDANLSFYISLTGCSGRELHSLKASLLFKFGLSEIQKTIVRDLTYYDRRRLSLASAVAGKPQLLLADEPTANLDPDHAKNMTELINLVRKGGTAVLWTTHNYDVLKKINGRVYLLDKKQLNEIPVKNR